VTSEIEAAGAARAAPGSAESGFYRLCAHVHACIDHDTMVFLDLRRNRYWSVPLAYAPCISGLSEHSNLSGGKTPKLVELGLIEPGCRVEAYRARARAPEARVAFVASAKVSLGTQAAFWLACARASHALAVKRLDRTFNTLASVRQNIGAPRLTASAAVSSFESLRPWYPHKRICLFDALALSFFLSSQHIASELVIGVRASPFAAHCWVETGGALAGDMSDHCASFTPIAWV